MSINLTKLTTDLNAHQNLPDQPTLTASQLKTAWDKPANDIKAYINNTLIDEVEDGYETTLESAKSYADTQIAGIDLDAESITYDNTSSGLEAESVQDAIDELKTSIGEVSSDADSKVAYDDFVVTEHTVSYTNYGGLYDVENTLDITNSGYMPLAIVGHSNSALRNTYRVTWDYLSSRTSGSATIDYKYAYDYQGGGKQSFSAKWYVLWVKIS